jgi:selenocysteine-specific elongation factor
MILGTAGHIDHGKTALVRALTGVDTDRLPEEKRRGITIDLGFAPLRLPSGRTIGVIDVPGHEAFVRTMLAGATGIDLALLVIAADEGPMPQTREHLAILELLDVGRGIVALTKADLVDDDWMTLVRDDVRTLLSGTSLAEAPIIAASSVSGAGIDELRQTIEKLASEEPRAGNDIFRLPVDRAFSVKGTGTVVTGTVWSGSLKVEDNVRIMPSGTVARVRGIQSHGASLGRATAGVRAAIALAGVDADAVTRGATLVARPEWNATLVARADVTMLPGAPTLRPRTRVRFHVATSDVGARIVALGGAVEPGTRRPVRIVLDEPVLLRSGDRFVIRSASPLTTIGGGVITDSMSPRRARPMPTLDIPPHERLTLLAEEAGNHGLSEASIPVRLGVTPDQVRDVVASAGDIVRVGDRLFVARALETLSSRVAQMVKSHHEERPLDAGAPREEVRSRLGIDAAVFEHLLASLARERKLEASGAELRLPGRAPSLNDQQQRLIDELMDALKAAGHEPPSVAELQARFGPQTLSLLRHLERQHRVVQVEDARFYTPDAVRELLHRLESGMTGKGELAPTDLREVLGFSRKFLIPFLEYCDRRGYTARQGNGRVWRGVKTG